MTSYCTIEEAWGTSDLSSDQYPPANVLNYNVNRMHENMTQVGAPVADEEYSKLLQINQQKQYKHDSKRFKKKEKRTKSKKYSNNHLEVETASELSNIDRISSGENQRVPMYMQSPNGLNNTMSLNENVGVGGIDGLSDNSNIHSLQYVPEPLTLDNSQYLSTPLIRNGDEYDGDDTNEELVKENYSNINKLEKSNGYENINTALKEMMDRLDRMESTLSDIKHNKNNSSKSNIHDIVLFVLMGIFLIFILDSIFRVGRMTPNLASRSLLTKPKKNKSSRVRKSKK